MLLITHTADVIRERQLVVTRARDAWDALDKIHEEWALVICSLTMRTDTGARLYSLLWKAQPELKRRFALLVDYADDSNRALTRPLGAAAVMR